MYGWISGGDHDENVSSSTITNNVSLTCIYGLIFNNTLKFEEHIYFIADKVNNNNKILIGPYYFQFQTN